MSGKRYTEDIQGVHDELRETRDELSAGKLVRRLMGMRIGLGFWRESQLNSAKMRETSPDPSNPYWEGGGFNAIALV